MVRMPDTATSAEDADPGGRVDVRADRGVGDGEVGAGMLIEDVGQAREAGLDAPGDAIGIGYHADIDVVPNPVNESIDAILADAAALADLPDLLCRPLSRPFRIDEGVSTGGRPHRRLHLDEVDHLESVSPQQADPIAEAEVELDPRIVRPLEAMHAEIGPQEALRRRALLLGIRDGEDPEGAVRQEDQLAAGAQESSGLGNPAVRIGPDGCPVLADGEVEACIGQSGRLGIAVDERGNGGRARPGASAPC